MRVSPRRFCLFGCGKQSRDLQKKKRVLKRTGPSSPLSSEVQPSWRLARVLAMLLGFGKCCGFTARANGPPGTEQVDLHPVMGRSRSRPVSKKSARRIPSASRARKGDGKRRDRLDGARGSDGGERVWWRDPETGGLSGVARRSLVAAAAQLAFAAVVVKSQRLYDVWRGAGWGESSWRSVTHGGGRDASLAQRWSAETRGWRERRDGGSSLSDW